MKFYRCSATNSVQHSLTFPLHLPLHLDTLTANLLVGSGRGDKMRAGRYGTISSLARRKFIRKNCEGNSISSEVSHRRELAKIALEMIRFEAIVGSLVKTFESTASTCTVVARAEPLLLRMKNAELLSQEILNRCCYAQNFWSLGDAARSYSDF